MERVTVFLEQGNVQAANGRNALAALRPKQKYAITLTIIAMALLTKDAGATLALKESAEIPHAKKGFKNAWKEFGVNASAQPIQALNCAME